MKERVLFLCTGNSCRSQMAEGIFRHLAGNRYDVFSAGTNPIGVNPLAIKIMDEVGIDISRQRSKSVNEFSGQKFDYVITVCDNAKETCPVFPGEYNKLHWDLEDPAVVEGTEEEKELIFRKVRNQIKENILKFLNIPRDKASLKCPYCRKIQDISIPQNACLHRYACTYCSKVILPIHDSCCVICSYSDKNCPSFSI